MLYFVIHINTFLIFRVFPRYASDCRLHWRGAKLQDGSNSISKENSFIQLRFLSEFIKIIAISSCCRWWIQKGGNCCLGPYTSDDPGWNEHQDRRNFFSPGTTMQSWCTSNSFRLIMPYVRTEWQSHHLLNIKYLVFRLRIKLLRIYYVHGCSHSIFNS